jgi:hypothetical protein
MVIEETLKLKNILDNWKYPLAEMQPVSETK